MPSPTDRAARADAFMQPLRDRYPHGEVFLRAVGDVAINVPPVGAGTTDGARARLLARLAEPDRIAALGIV